MSPSKFILAFISATLFSLTSAQAQLSPLYRPAPSLSADELAVIVNDNDPLSRQIADYYAEQRHIPPDQVIHVQFPPRKAVLTESEFKHIKLQVDAKTPKRVQAFALTWLQPFRVECMSITTAFAAGFDREFCAKGCQQTRGSPYFASDTGKPFDTYGWRPAMTLAAADFAEAKRLIDRGIASDFSQPRGTAYLLNTKDKARSSRAVAFPKVASALNPYWPVQYLEQDYIEGRKDVMFYFTGLIRVPHLSDNQFLPGAVADHLTSAGGVMSGSDQMNVMEWLRAGATASYGAVVEPCNFPVKFSNPGLLLYNYLRGSTVIEAYWKSVAQPGQGLFVGEPLARPFGFR